jgi:hypothetical protein
MMIVSRREEIIESVLQFLESGYYDAFHNLAHTTHRKRGCQLLQRPSGLEGIFSLERHAISRVPRVSQQYPRTLLPHSIILQCMLLSASSLQTVVLCYLSIALNKIIYRHRAIVI